MHISGHRGSKDSTGTKFWKLPVAQARTVFSAHTLTFPAERERGGASLAGYRFFYRAFFQLP